MLGLGGEALAVELGPAAAQLQCRVVAVKPRFLLARTTCEPQVVLVNQMIDQIGRRPRRLARRLGEWTLALALRVKHQDVRCDEVLDGGLSPIAGAEAKEVGKGLVGQVVGTRV